MFRLTLESWFLVFLMSKLQPMLENFNVILILTYISLYKGGSKINQQGQVDVCFCFVTYKSKFSVEAAQFT